MGTGRPKHLNSTGSPGHGLVLAAVLALASACDSAASQGKRDASPDAADSSVTINVKINNCPDVTSASASPLSTSVGQTIDVVAMATDQDATDSLTYLWIATSGSFSDPLTAAPTYTCTGRGVHVLILRVSDGKCDDATTVAVTCL